MKRIMFVCHGNICRSPMAEFIFKDMLAGEGIAEEYTVASTATSTEEISNGTGNPVYPPARAELKKHGISCDGKRATQLRAEDYDRYDIFLVMDSNNMRNIKSIFPEDPQGKVHKLMEFTERGGDVADPWFTRQFDVAYRDIYDGCKGLLKYLRETDGRA